MPSLDSRRVGERKWARGVENSSSGGGGLTSTLQLHLYFIFFFKLKSRQSGSVQLSFKDGERREKKASFFLVLFVCCDPQLKSLSDEAASFGQSWKTRQFFLFVLLINGGGKGG